MVQINFAKREVQCKVVYYGPARSGKTAALQSILEKAPSRMTGKLTSIATDTNRTLFFDFLSLDLGPVAGIRTKVHLYAVPYIENQNAVRLLVLEGVDGIVFVGDSARERVDDNVEAMRDLVENFQRLGRELEQVPIVFQWNKSDLQDTLTPVDLDAMLNEAGHPSIATSAESGAGILTALKAITHSVLAQVARSSTGQPSASVQQAASAAEPEMEEERENTSTSSKPPIVPLASPDLPEVEQRPPPTFRPAWHRPRPDGHTSTSTSTSTGTRFRRPELDKKPDHSVPELPAAQMARERLERPAGRQVRDPLDETLPNMKISIEGREELSPAPATTNPDRNVPVEAWPVDPITGTDQDEFGAQPVESEGFDTSPGFEGQAAIIEPPTSSEPMEPRAQRLQTPPPPREPRPIAPAPVDDGFDAVFAGPPESSTDASSRMVSVGGPARVTLDDEDLAEDGWVRHAGAEDWRNLPKPATDRRRTPRTPDTRMPKFDLVAGTLVSVLSLIAIGYLVHVYL